MRDFDELIGLGENGMKEIADKMCSPDFKKLDENEKIDYMGEYLFLKATKDNPELAPAKQEKIYKELKYTLMLRNTLSALSRKLSGEKCLNELNSEYFSDSIYGRYITPITGYTDAQLTGYFFQSNYGKNVNREYSKALDKGDTSEFHKMWNDAKTARLEDIERRRRQNEEAEEKRAADREKEIREHEKKIAEKNRLRREQELAEEAEKAKQAEAVMKAKEKAAAKAKPEAVEKKQAKANNGLGDLFAKKPAPKAPKQPTAEELRQKKIKELLSDHIIKMGSEDDMLSAAEQKLDNLNTPADNQKTAKDLSSELEEFKRETARKQLLRSNKHNTLNEMESNFSEKGSFDSMSEKEKLKFMSEYMLLLGKSTPRYEKMSNSEQEYADSRLSEKIKNASNQRSFKNILEKANTGSDVLALLNTTYIQKSCFGRITMDGFNDDVETEQEKYLDQFLFLEWGGDIGGAEIGIAHEKERADMRMKLIEDETKAIAAKQEKYKKELDKLEIDNNAYNDAWNEFSGLKNDIAQNRYDREKLMIREGVSENEISSAEKQYTAGKEKSFRLPQNREKYIKNTAEINSLREDFKQEDFLNNLDALNINAELENNMNNLNINEVENAKKSEPEPFDIRPKTVDEQFEYDIEPLNINAEQEKIAPQKKNKKHTEAAPLDKMPAPPKEEKKVEAPKAEEKVEEPEKTFTFKQSLETLRNFKFKQTLAKFHKDDPQEEKKVEAPKEEPKNEQQEKTQDELENININEEIEKAEEERISNRLDDDDFINKRQTGKVRQSVYNKAKEPAPVDVMPEAPESVIPKVPTEVLTSEIAAIAQKAHDAQRGVWLGSGKYDNASATLDKLSAAMQTLHSFDNSDNASLHTKSETLKTIIELNKELKERTQLYFDRKKGQHLLTDDGKMPDGIKEKTAKRIRTMQEAMELNAKIEQFIQAKTSEYNAISEKRNEKMSVRYPVASFAEPGHIDNDRGYYSMISDKANQAKNTLKNAITGGKPIDLNTKLSCVAKIMVNETLTNAVFRDDNDIAHLGQMTEYLPEAGKDPNPTFYSNQLSMMKHDKVFIAKVANLSDDQLIDFLGSPYKLTNSYVNDPKKATSLESTIKAEDSMKKQNKKSKTADKTKEKKKTDELNKKNTVTFKVKKTNPKNTKRK